WGDIIAVDMNQDNEEGDSAGDHANPMMNVGHFSKFTAARDGIKTGANFITEENEQSEKLSEDPLVTLLLNEKPLDPFFDFDWMDESYCLDYTSKLFPV